MYNVNKIPRQKRSDIFCQAIRDAVKSDEERRSVILLLLHMPVPRACPTSVYFCLFLYFCLVIVLFSKDHKSLFRKTLFITKDLAPCPQTPNTTHQIIPIPRCSLPHLRFNISPYWALQFSMIMTTFWWYCVKPVHYKYSCRSAKKIRKYECNKKRHFSI